MGSSLLFRPLVALVAVLLSLQSIPLHPRQAKLLEDCARDSPPDALVCLGYTCDHERGLPSPTLQYRVEAAVALWRRWPGAALVFSGGSGERVRPGLPTEADVMAAYAERLLGGVVDGLAGISLERESTSTRENALFSLPLLNCSAGGTVAIVTSTFHQWRARRVFQSAAKELGLDECRFEIVALPCASAGERAPTQHDWLRELAACALYWWRGWI